MNIDKLMMENESLMEVNRINKLIIANLQEQVSLNSIMYKAEKDSHDKTLNTVIKQPVYDIDKIQAQIDAVIERNSFLEATILALKEENRSILEENHTLECENRVLRSEVTRYA